MSHILRIELSDEMYRIAEEAARRAGKTVEEWAAGRLRNDLPEADQEPQLPHDRPRKSLMDYVGALSFEPFESNEEIDRALAEEYGSTHEDEE